MSGAVSSWLIAVTCAALIAAVVDSLMPGGPIRQVGKLACTLMVMWAVLQPLLSLQPGDPLEYLGGIRDQAAVQQEQLSQVSGGLLKKLIEQQTAAYIVDKATGCGFSCQVEVTCEPGEAGTWVPCRVDVRAEDASDKQREALTQLIREEIGVSSQQLFWAGGE
ncbi:MAG: hypothetical protein J6A62_08135 [Oscillospiraceae bacterium]|nr:hypothetical protein [Oscillospiraceae bacterium]